MSYVGIAWLKVDKIYRYLGIINLLFFSLHQRAPLNLATEMGRVNIAEYLKVYML